MYTRELTGREKQAIRRLVRTMCASFDEEYECLPLDGTCYRFTIAFNTRKLCKYFQSSVLPLDPKLERVFIGGAMPDTKPCAICGRAFTLNGRQTYCSKQCAATGRRRSVARNVKAHRERERRDVIN
jgi:hypothetical protein